MPRSHGDDGAGTLFNEVSTVYLWPGWGKPALSLSGRCCWRANERRSKIDTCYRHDDFGNITHIFEHGADLEQGDERTTTIAYNPAVEPYIVGLPWEVTISAGVPPAVQPANRITYYCYDGDNGSDFANCSGKPTKGLLTATQLVDDEGFYVTTTYAHDAYGDLTAVQTCSIIMDG